MLGITIEITVFMADVSNKLTIYFFLNILWKWTQPLVGDESPLMKKIHGLKRNLDEAQQKRREEGIKRSRWIIMFGSLKGYTTDWVDIDGRNHLYKEQRERKKRDHLDFTDHPTHVAESSNYSSQSESEG